MWNLIGIWLMGRKIKKQENTTKEFHSSDSTEDKHSGFSH
jgi:hypothetical protein